MGKVALDGWLVCLVLGVGALSGWFFKRWKAALRSLSAPWKSGNYLIGSDWVDLALKPWL